MKKKYILPVTKCDFFVTEILMLNVYNGSGRLVEGD